MTEQRREYLKKYRKTHRDEHADYSRKYYQNHRDEQAKYKRKYMRQYRESQKNHCVYCLETADHRIYIGSTNYIDRRLLLHKQRSISHPDRLLYKVISETGGWDTVNVHILMRDIPDKDLRLKLEQHFINKVPEQLSLNSIDAITKRG
jgi:hypothetical protein